MANLTPKHQEILHALDRTRFTRLPRTQFVYWPTRSAQPKIEHKGGAHTYLRETPVVYRVQPGADLLEYMKQVEHQLFDTPDESVVYWRGWNIFSLEYTFIQAEFCIAHIWDNEVHTEAKHAASAPQPRINLVSLKCSLIPCTK